MTPIVSCVSYMQHDLQDYRCGANAPAIVASEQGAKAFGLASSWLNTLLVKITQNLTEERKLPCNKYTD